MKYYASFVITLLMLACCTLTIGQTKLYSTANAHAHNDYLNTRPFFDAYSHGFGSIEADVFPRDGKLLVAHSKNEIKPGNTLARLYFEPLYKEITSGKRRRIILLIDIKEDHKKSLALLLNELEPLKPFLNMGENAKLITIIISGERPAPEDFKEYPPFIFFDSDLKQKYSEREWQRVALVSLPFNKISSWKGDRDPVENELEAVKRVVDSVHQSGKPIRFWAAPDTSLSWKWQQALQVDLIGTDKISELSIFLKKEDD
jgi:alkaline phosphatase